MQQSKEHVPYGERKGEALVRSIVGNGIAGKVRAGGFGTQQQGGASGVCETRLDENSILGRLRTTRCREI
jgi:hypothetical protein